MVLRLFMGFLNAWYQYHLRSIVCKSLRTAQRSVFCYKQREFTSLCFITYCYIKCLQKPFLTAYQGDYFLTQNSID